MFFDLYDLYQNHQIRNAADKAERARDLAGDLEMRVEALERRVVMLTWTAEALWDFIKRHHPVEDEDLSALLKTIAERAGQPDGRAVKEAVRSCPQCGKVLLKTTGTCLNCGYRAAPEPFGH